MASERYRNWALVVYPDSLPDSWIDIIKGFHVPCLISPLHAADSAPDPSEPVEVAYKDHYHVVFCFDGVQTFDQVQAMTSVLNGTRPFRLFSRNGYIRYLIHKDNPEKPQYEYQDIQCFGADDVLQEAFDIGEYDTQKVISEINDWILSQGCSEFADLYIEACDHPKWAYVLNKFPCKSVHALLASLRYGR